MNIINVSPFEPEWNWLADRFADRAEQSWRHVSTQSLRLPAWLPRRDLLSRALAARAACRLAPAGESSLLVSHGPRMSVGVEFANRRRSKRAAHLAYAFNYTELPTHSTRAFHARGLATVDRFVVFSTVERALYAKCFDLPIERIDMIHWAVRPPVALDLAPFVPGSYLCAVGGQGRDYAVLAEAMRALPKVRLVIVASRAAIAGVDVPDNVEVRLDTSLEEATNIIAHCDFMVLPLRDADVPCGHVTLVSAMHRAKAIVATRSSGVADYLSHDATSLLVPPKDPVALAQAIEQMVDDPSLRDRLGKGGRDFALANCTEDRAVAYFSRYLAQLHAGNAERVGA